ncbi:MAG: SRPBCC family protein [Pseudomarimonas sp.]
MHVDLIAKHSFQSAPEAVFALGLDPLRFPAAFRGFGPIPSIRSMTLHAPPAVGSTRELENSDGSRPQERITALEPPHRHAYTLSGLSAPFSWLVRAGHADWSFTAVAQGTAVEWRYRFELTSPLAWPLASPLLNLFMTAAMRRCLATMAMLLESDEVHR